MISKMTVHDPAPVAKHLTTARRAVCRGMGAYSRTFIYAAAPRTEEQRLARFAI
jgi:hypothetical protein